MIDTDELRATYEQHRGKDTAANAVLSACDVIDQLRERNKQVEAALHAAVVEAIPALQTKGGYVLSPDTFGTLAALYSPAIAQLRALHVKAKGGLVTSEDITAALEAMKNLQEHEEADATPDGH